MAGSAHFYDLDKDILVAWLDDYRERKGVKHTPSERTVRSVGVCLASRQRYRPEFADYGGGYVVNEGIGQLAKQLGLGYGTVADAVAFLDDVGIVVTLRSGGKGAPTGRCQVVVATTL